MPSQGGMYAPWLADEAFLTTYHAIRPYTLVDWRRCWELWDLARNRLGHIAGDIIEVGTWRGGTGALLAKAASQARRPPNVFLCDTFAGIVKAGPMDNCHKDGGLVASRASVEAALRISGATATILEGVFPEATGHLVAGRTFRMCHVDVDVYQSAEDVYDWVWPRLAVGGVLVYDDYGFSTCQGVTHHLNRKSRRGDGVLLYNLNGHGVFVKTA